MTFDTLTMIAVAGELQELAGARVQRVIQPSREEIVLSLYHCGEEHSLLLSAHPPLCKGSPDPAALPPPGAASTLLHAPA